MGKNWSKVGKNRDREGSIQRPLAWPTPVMHYVSAGRETDCNYRTIGVITEHSCKAPFYYRIRIV
jgi:hypothetical protein